LRRKEIPVSLRGELPKNFKIKGIKEFKLPSILMFPVGAESVEMILEMCRKY